MNLWPWSTEELGAIEIVLIDWFLINLLFAWLID